jgi:hypothetical protein
MKTPSSSRNLRVSLDSLSNSVERVPWALLLIIGCTLRLISVFAAGDLAADEMASLFFAQTPFNEALQRDHAAPFFSLLLRGWIQVFPPIEWWLRLLPFVISTATLFAVAKLFRSKWLLLLLIFYPASIEFAAELKNSSLFELIGFIYAYSVFNFIDSNNDSIKKSAFTLIAASGLLVVTHYVGLLLIISSLPFLVHRTRPHKASGIIFWTSTFVCLGVAGFAVDAFLIKHHALAWMKISFPEGLSHVTFLPLLVVGSYSRVIAILLALITIFLIRQRSVEAMWLLIAYLTFAFVQFYFEKSLSHRRFLIPLELLSLLVMATFVSKARSFDKLNIAVLIGLIVCFVLNFKKIGEDWLKIRSDWQSAASEICQSTRPGPIFYFGHPSFRYYFEFKNINCATYGAECSVLTKQESDWVVDQVWHERFKAMLAKCSSDLKITLIKRYGERSQEPLFLYNVSHHSKAPAP